MSGTVPYVKTSVAIRGERQIDAFEAICHITGRKPYQLAADIVLQYIKEHRDDDAVVELVAARRSYQSEAEEEQAMVKERRACIRLVQ